MRLLLIVFLFAGFGTALTQRAPAASGGRTVLPGHVAFQAVKPLTATGALDPKRQLRLDLVLPLRDQADLNDLMRRLYDPADPLYGQYLTPAQFTERFGPSLSDVNAVAAFAKSQGLTVTSISQNRAIVRVSGPVSAIEPAFGVKLQGYAGKDGADFYGTASEPTVPAAIAGKLLAVVGLNHLGKPTSFLHRAHPKPTSPEAVPLFARSSQDISFSGNAGLAPKDIRSIYNLTGVTSQGTGQTIALYELDTYTPGDIAEYEQFYDIPSVPLQNVGVDGFDPTTLPGGAAVEVTLDLEMCLALAPDAGKIIVYEGNGNTDFETVNVEIFNQIATDNLASVVSVSYGLSELDVTQADAQAVNQTLMQLAAQGQTVCIASGDAGAYTDQSLYPNELPNTSEPGSQPLVLSVGGTDMTDSSTAPYTYVSETSWYDPDDSSRGSYGVGGGGGISQYWAIPSYQVGSFSTSANPQGSTTMRNVPDVSLYSYSNDDTGGYDVYFTDPGFGAQWYGIGGTSAATPLWAAFLTDVNQARVAGSKPKLGLANTSIYAVAKQPSKYATDFHDINDDSTNIVYHAVAGYDDSTGWGSFNGVNLYNDLVSYAASVSVQSLNFSPNPVLPGATTTGTVTLTSPAPTGGAAVVIAGTGISNQTVTVPAGASSVTFQHAGSTTPGTYTVTATYNGATASAILGVTSGVPTITSFTPGSGFPGSVVVVTGTGFTNVSEVTLNGLVASSYTYSDTSFEFLVPAGATSGKIGVVSPSGTSLSANSFTVLSVYPVITSFSPASGAPGTAVTVTGTGFAGTIQVTLNGQPVGYSAVTNTGLTFTVPSGATSGKVAVTTLVGTGQSSANFTVTAASAPRVTSFSPTSGSPGTVVTVTGTGFTGVTKVTLNGVSASYSFASDTSLTFTVPSGATTGKIAVTTSAGTGQSAASFTVTTAAVPTITGISPTSGSAGTTVTITGTNLGGVTTVTVGGVSVAFTVVNSTTITFVVPAGLTGGTVTVTAPGGSATSSVTFTVATWNCVDVSSSGDGTARMLWRRSDGVAGLWTLNSADVQSLVGPTYGPYADGSAMWTARSVATATNGTSRVLWTRSDGAMGVWTFNASDVETNTGVVYGPISGGWTATDVAAASDGTARVLWTSTSGQAMVWTLNASGTETTEGTVYGPYTDSHGTWMATAVGVAGDGTSRLLWDRSDGAAGVWSLGTNDVQTVVGTTYGPYTGWKADDLGTSSNGTSNVLWKNVNGSSGVWTFNSQDVETVIGTTYGPISDSHGTWSTMALDVANGVPQVLWVRSDRAAGVWSFNSSGVNTVMGTVYGPY